MIVVDTGATDNTKQIAIEHGAHVFDFQWCDDFSAARNSASKCTGEWWMWLDADDDLSSGIEAIQGLKNTEFRDAGIDAIICPYDDDPEASPRTSPLPYRERFFRRSAGSKWCGRVHENVTYSVSETVCRSRPIIEHRPPYVDRASKDLRNARITAKWGIEIDLEQATFCELVCYGQGLMDSKQFGEAITIFQKALARRSENDALLAQTVDVFLRICQNQVSQVPEDIASVSIGADT
jgi:glycosyltransferase involved in cell wall biosynthesis